MAWDTHYRPLKFEDVLGQEGAVQLLKARLAKGSALDTNFIFAGGHGQGKTTLARILARAMLCLDLNKDDPEPCNVCDNCTAVLDGMSMAYVEQDAASGGTIDNIRSIVEDLPFAVFNAAKRVYVFDEAHRMSRDAQDVLLKPLEEKRMVGIFCTTEPEKIRGPIRSRCEEYTIRKITREDVLVRMKRILDTEGVPHEDDAVLTVIDYSGGHVRDVLNRLEMVAQMGAVTLTNVREYLHLSSVGTYYEILLNLADSKRAVELVEQACERVSAEDVAAGIAEAAMNSFRLAHGMFTEFVYVDKILAQQVFTVYGTATVRLAEFFLRSRYYTKISLICDVLSLQGGVQTGIQRVEADRSVPIVVAQLPSPPPVVTPTVEAPAAAPASPPVAPSVETTAVKAAPPASPTPKAPPAPTASTAPKSHGTRPDGVGSLGSSDVGAMTECDDRAVPSKMPRRRTNATALVLPVLKEGSSEELTPEQWVRDFMGRWAELRRG